MFIQVTVNGIYPVLFDPYLNESDLFEQIDAFAIITQDIAPELMKLQCFKAICGNTIKCHCGITLSSMFLVGNKYSDTGSPVKMVKVKNVDSAYCLLSGNKLNHKPQLSGFINTLMRISDIPFKSVFGERGNCIADDPVRIVVFPFIE